MSLYDRLIDWLTGVAGNMARYYADTAQQKNKPLTQSNSGGSTNDNRQRSASEILEAIKNGTGLDVTEEYRRYTAITNDFKVLAKSIAFMTEPKNARADVVSGLVSDMVENFNRFGMKDFASDYANFFNSADEAGKAWKTYRNNAFIAMSKVQKELQHIEDFTKKGAAEAIVTQSAASQAERLNSEVKAMLELLKRETSDKAIAKGEKAKASVMPGVLDNRAEQLLREKKADREAEANQKAADKLAQQQAKKQPQEQKYGPNLITIIQVLEQFSGKEYAAIVLSELGLEKTNRIGTELNHKSNLTNKIIEKLENDRTITGKDKNTIREFIGYVGNLHEQVKGRARTEQQASDINQLGLLHDALSALQEVINDPTKPVRKPEVQNPVVATPEPKPVPAETIAAPELVLVQLDVTLPTPPLAVPAPVVVVEAVATAAQNPVVAVETSVVQAAAEAQPVAAVVPVTPMETTTSVNDEAALAETRRIASKPVFFADLSAEVTTLNKFGTGAKFIDNVYANFFDPDSVDSKLGEKGKKLDFHLAVAKRVANGLKKGAAPLSGDLPILEAFVESLTVMQDHMRTQAEANGLTVASLIEDNAFPGLEKMQGLQDAAAAILASTRQSLQVTGPDSNQL